MEYTKLNTYWLQRQFWQSTIGNRKLAIEWRRTEAIHSSWGILVAFFVACNPFAICHFSLEWTLRWLHDMSASDRPGWLAGCPAGIIIIYINLSGHQRRDLSESKLGAQLQLQVQVQSCSCKSVAGLLHNQLRLYFFFDTKFFI